MYKINGRIENDKAIMIEDNMILDKRILGKKFDTKKIDATFAQIRQLSQWCKNHGIYFVFLIVPQKELHIHSNLIKEQNYSNDLYVYTQRQEKFPILYPAKIFDKKYPEYLFAHTDTHYTEFGAFLVYKDFMSFINKKFSMLKTSNINEFDIFYNTKPRLGSFKNLFDRPFYLGSNCNLLKLSEKKCPLNHKYAYFNHHDLDFFDIKFGPMNMSRIIKNPKANNKLKLTLLGASHGGFLMEFLPSSFYEVLMFRVNNQDLTVKNVYDMSRFEKHILDFKTNILLLYVPETDIPNVKFYE